MASEQLDQHIHVMKFDLKTRKHSEITTRPPILMANGMTKTPDRSRLLVLSQGKDATGGAIYEVAIDKPKLSIDLSPNIDELNTDEHAASVVIDSYMGDRFNSPNDIVSTSDGLIFFSDPAYGFEQGFRTNGRMDGPELGGNVWRLDNKTGVLSLLTVALKRPNGVALWDMRRSGGGCRLLLSDTAFETGAQTLRGFGRGDSALYLMTDPDDHGCFDTKSHRQDSPLVPLLPSTQGIQDGLKIHQPSGLAFICEGSGLYVFSLAMSRLVGIVRLPTKGKPGCTQVAFDEEALHVTTVYVLAETKLFAIDMNFEKPEWGSDREWWRT